MGKQIKEEWVTHLKFIGIIAVILGHIASPLNSFLYTWHMPLFFMISGFFIRPQETTKDYLLKQLPRNFIPYFAFAILALIFESLKRYALNRPEVEWEESFLGIFVWMDYNSLTGSYAFVLWFLPTLFFARLFVYMALKHIPRQWMVAVILLGLFSLSFYIQLPFAIDEAMNATIFVFLGYWIYRQDYKVWALVPIWLVFYYYFGFSSLDLASKSYGNIVANIVIAVSSCILLIKLCKGIQFNSSIMIFWGSNTLLLFIVHPYTNNIAFILSGKLLSGNWFVTLTLSLLMLHGLLVLKKRFNHLVIFRHV